MERDKSGVLFLFTGNPGSGKDSVVNGIIKRWNHEKEVELLKRTITRKNHDSEDYTSVSKEDFSKMLEKGCFSFWWESYGIYYGLPGVLYSSLEKGKVVFANVSRDAVSGIKKKIKDTKSIFIFVDPKIGLERVKKRGREKAGSDEFEKRKNKLFNQLEFSGADFTADNSNALEDTIEDVKNYIFSQI